MANLPLNGMTGIPAIGIFFFVACDEPRQMTLTMPSKGDENRETDSPSKEVRPIHELAQQDTVYHGYNEMTDPANRKTYTISDYNTDNPAIENIDRPATSTIETHLDTSLLFGVWGHDPDGPHADFVISRENIYYVDYDGDGRMPYELKGNKLTIWFNDFVSEVEIVSVDKDTLKIRGFSEVSALVRWAQ